MVTANPPGAPVFYPGMDTVTQFNTGLDTPAGQSGGIRDTTDFMLNRPKFRARRVASQTVTENANNFIVWDTIDTDNYGGGVSGSSIYTVQVPGWYLVTARVTLSQSTAGAANLIVIPSVCVNRTSPINIGSPGWEGAEIGVPLGSTDPKCSNGIWKIYGNTGDQIEINMYYSIESAITTTGTTLGFQPNISLVWSSK